MSYLLVRHQVRDYAQWRAHFDAHAGHVRAAGGRDIRLFRTGVSPNDVLVLVAWDSTAAARRFVEAQDMRQVMRAAGVVGVPEVLYLEEL
jgi:heme-degrading monooxygenase HmoA